MGEHTRGAVRKTAPVRPVAARRTVAAEPPGDRRGTVSIGRIETLSVAHGFIQLGDRRDVFFHRSDLREGVSLAALAVGDRVTFELIDDQISGPRAVQVARRRPRRATPPVPRGHGSAG